MRDLEEKVNDLAKQVEAMRSKNVKSTRVATIIYILLVIFVFGYTTTIMNMLKAKTTADSLSAQATIMIHDGLLTENNRQWVLDYCNEQSPIIAKGLVNLTHEQIIPSLKVKIKSQIDQQVDSIIVRLEKDVYPEVNKVLTEHINELKKHSDITDHKIAIELAQVLANDLDKEMSTFINDKLKHRMELLSNEFNKISSKPYDKLTAKEAAERRLIVNWVYLMEHHESPGNIFKEMIQGANATYESLLKDFKLK